DGRGYPATLDQAIAQQKVVIDTQPPTVNLHSLPSGNGQVGVEWQVSDDNLDLNSLILEYRVGAGDWQPLSAEHLAVGRKVWSPSTNAALQVRLRVNDLAGNPGEGTTSVAAIATGVGPAAGQEAYTNRSYAQ